MNVVRKRWVSGAILLAASLAHAQRSASSVLTVQVSPETQVQPAQTNLRLAASKAGNTTQAAAVTAKVRAEPGATIHLQATVSNLSGPNGPVAPGLLTWTASATQSLGGGTRASCLSGSFASGGVPGNSVQELAQGWTQSGTLQCTLIFRISDSAAAGEYSGIVRFSVSSQ